MKREFILTCPRERIAATYYVLDDGTGYDKFTVDGLTGCMGLICVIEHGRRPALLAHDATDGYPYAKQQLERFIAAHPGHTADMHIVWSAVLSCGQAAWMSTHLLGAHIRVEATGVGHSVISYPERHEGETTPEREGHEIQRAGGALRALERSDRAWQPDGDVTACPICNAAFGFFTRKHHCRNCGRVVCAACSPESSQLGPAFNHLSHSVHRYCTQCVPSPGRAVSLSW